ncbi:PepSY-associated TM helix domain-containing protein [Luteibacter sp. CQ10]|uniref:PepSY-associated TM helix domain-containing protein n=1 Tax=Luteibacter sp. CQ10 TaxID=2805821 RepID=UPI0034A37EDE
MAGKLFSSHTIRRFTSVHSWIGIACGVALFIAFYGGALTMYERDIDRWANPATRHASGTLAQIDAFVTELAGKREVSGDLDIDLGDDGNGPLRATIFAMGDGQFSESIVAMSADGHASTQAKPSSVGRLINEIHFSLGIPGTAGYTFLGLVSVAYGLALVTGLIIHLPHLVRDLFSLKRSASLKKMWTDAHNVIGVLSLPFHLMFAFTATLLCILPVMSEATVHVMATDAPYEQYQRHSDEGGHGRGGRADGKGQPTSAVMLSPARLLFLATNAAPELRMTRLTYQGYGTSAAVATVQGVRFGSPMPNGAVTLSAETGEVHSVRVPGLWQGTDALNELYVHLHEGDFGGEVLRATYFILGLAGSFLFYSGNLLWIETRRKRRVDAQPTRTRLIAQVTVGACLGCCLGVGGALLAARATDLPGVTEAWEGRAYFVIFFASIAWCLLRHPVRGAVDILRLSAATYLLLPVADMTLTGWRRGLGGVPADLVAVKMDIIFLAIGMSFLATARATRRRGMTGQPNSVWYIADPSAKPGARHASSR